MDCRQVTATDLTPPPLFLACPLTYHLKTAVAASTQLHIIEESNQMEFLQILQSLLRLDGVKSGFACPLRSLQPLAFLVDVFWLKYQSDLLLKVKLRCPKGLLWVNTTCQQKAESWSYKKKGNTVHSSLNQNVLTYPSNYNFFNKLHIS